ncbi:Uncharacterised protein [Bordetella pertussis]|nr:Uncharacterised protein [Bordetella pertussis]
MATLSPLRGRFCKLNGSDSESGRPTSARTQSTSYCSSISPRAGTVQRPTRTPLVQMDRLRLCDRRPMSPIRVGRPCGTSASRNRQLQP